MKKWCLFLSLYMLICLLAGCSAAQEGRLPALSAPDASPAAPARPKAAATMDCRVITGAEEGTLLVCGTGDDSGLYRLKLEEIGLYREGKPLEKGDGVQNGDIITIGYDGAVLETWPAKFSGVLWAEIRDGALDDRAALYLQVLEDLWETDSGLNHGITILGLDLSATSLTAAEQTGVAWAFGEARGLEVLEATWTQLCKEGYIDMEHLVWEDGCHFSITERAVEGTYSPDAVRFDAQKWRSGLGAYIFTDCTAVQNALGAWGEYTVGAHAIA